MAKLILAYHHLKVNDKAVVSALHDNILLCLQNHSNLISDEDLFEIFKAMCVSRSGSREMHKTIEYILSFRVKRIAENKEMIQNFFDIGNKSGLISPATLQSIRLLI